MEGNKEPKKAVSTKKRKWVKTIFLFLLVAFAAMQFFQPNKDNQSVDMSNDISKVVEIPDTVQALLKAACYDCHSNNTNYPWYSNIQPVGWWLKDHIEEGKQHLNFQEFAALKPRPNSKYKTVAALQAHKLEEVKETQEDRSMPLDSYLWIHTESKLTDGQRKMIIEWAEQAIQKIETSGGS